MKVIPPLLGSVLALVLVGCGSTSQTPAPDASADSDATTAPRSSPSIAPAPLPTPTPDPASAASPSRPLSEPAVLTPDAARGETGARDVLLDFARAIELGRYPKAYALLSPADREKWSASAFAAIFRDLRDITVAVPTGTLEGAAGSSYYTAPVTVTALDGDGRPVRLEGEAVLRRVNDVPGATPMQTAWHFERLTLNATH